MLSRTVTVGAKYAAELFLSSLIGLCILLAVFLWFVVYDHDYVVVAWIVVAYCIIDLAGALFAFSRIRGKYEQIQADLRQMRKLVLNAQYGKFPHRDNA